MTKPLGFFFVLKNRYFRRIVSYDRKKMFFILFLSLISIGIYVSFPLVTQVYIKYVYHQLSLSVLLSLTLLFFLLFLLKLFIDIGVEKYKTRYYLFVEKKIRRLIFEKYYRRLGKLMRRRSDLFTKHVNLYILLLKTMHNNILDAFALIIAGVIILFFDVRLFVYFLFSAPFFAIFYLIGKRIQVSYDVEEHAEGGADFALLLARLQSEKKSSKESWEIFAENIEKEFAKKTANRVRHISLNVTMRSFINFFRLFYLAYFGYYVIAIGVYVPNLIVGLLFITVLMRPWIRILQSIPFYSICARSFYKINSLYRK